MSNVEIKIKQLRGLRAGKATRLKKARFFVEVAIEGKKKKTGKLEWNEGPLEWNESLLFSSISLESSSIFSVFQANSFTPSTCYWTAERKISDMTSPDNEDIPLSLQAKNKKVENPEASLTVTIIIQNDIHAIAQIAIKNTAKIIKNPGRVATNLVETSNSATPVQPLEILDNMVPWEALLDKIDFFVQLTQKVAEVHPYAKLVSAVLLSAYHIWKARSERDQKVIALVKAMNDHCDFVQRARPVEELASQKEIMQKFMAQIFECSEFIRNHARNPSFVNRVMEALVSTVDQRIQDYQDAFKEFRTVFTQEGQLQSQITIMTVERDIARLRLNDNLNQMDYAAGTRYESGRACLPGTRVDILQEISDWVCDLDHSQRIFVLTGPAGAGKSAIANSLAKQFDRIGRLGSSFCFGRPGVLRALETFLPTIARDLTDRDPNFKKSLGKHIDSNKSLTTTKDLSDQFEQFIALHSGNSCFIGHVLIVIDALDESGDALQRSTLLRLLADPTMVQKLPPYVRIFITARPEKDIVGAFSRSSHAHILRLFDAVPAEDVKQDILAFVRHQLIGDSVYSLPDIEEDHCLQIAEKSQGLFQWAAVVCRLLKEAEAKALSPLEELPSLLMVPSSDLDHIYRAALDRNFAIDNIKLKERFRMIVGFILSAQEPLSSATLMSLVTAYNKADGQNAVNLILPRLGSLFNGVTGGGLMSPVHTSVREFLVDEGRSGNFYIQTEACHMGLTLATLKVLNNNLHFNMCKLGNSHIPNSDIIDLKARIEASIPTDVAYSSKFTGNHLQVSAKHLSSSVPSQAQELSILIKSFLEERLLFWLETLGLLRAADNAHSFLSAVITKYQIEKPRNAVIVRDTLRFIRTAGPIIEGATPHIYLSAMPFIPSDSVLRELFLPHCNQSAQVLEGLEKGWPYLEQTIILKSSVRCVTFSPDGRWIASASGNHIHIWDVGVGKLVAGPFQGHSHWVISIAFSPDGQNIVSGAQDKTIRVWDVHTGNCVRGPFEGHTSWVWSVAYSPDGQRIVSGSHDQNIQIWDTYEGHINTGPLMGHTGGIESVAFSNDGERIASGSMDNTVRIWDAWSGNLIAGPCQGHTSSVTSVAFSPNGRKIVSGSGDGNIRIWDAQNGDLIAGPFQSRMATRGITSVAFFPDGQKITSGSYDNSVQIFDAQTGTLLAGPLQSHSAGISSVAVSPDGQTVVSGSYDTTIKVWNIQGSNIFTSPFEGNKGWITSVAFSPNGQMLVSGSEENTIKLWDAQTGDLIIGSSESHAKMILCVAFSPDGERVVSGSMDNTIRIWDVQSGNMLVGPFQGHTGHITSVTFSFDGDKLVSSSKDKSIRIWDAYNGNIILDPLEGHTDCINSVTCFPDRQRIVSGSHDKTVRIWDMENGSPIGEPLQGHTNPINSVAVSPDGQKVVSGSVDKTIRIWDANTGNLIIGPIQGHQRGVSSVTFTPDGSKVVSGSWDKTVRIWNAATGDPMALPFRGHTGFVMSVAISPDGQKIVSASGDKTIRIWNAETSSFSGSKAVQTDLSLGTPNISFSPHTDHALNLSPLIQDKIVSLDSITFNSITGWILGPHKEHIFWIPPSYRDRIWVPRYLQLIGMQPATLDLSQLPHGSSWTQCWRN
ncbi:hypothetical protein M422DRAFT_776348 [Sphaerobolus stellatus SS14]|nr:hypothetical protein M422DRAFT_776348 [Sphaerobolus stellatus SS14]